MFNVETGRFVSLPGFDSPYAKQLIREFEVVKELGILCPPSSVFETVSADNVSGLGDTLVVEGRGKAPDLVWSWRIVISQPGFVAGWEDYQRPREPEDTVRVINGKKTVCNFEGFDYSR